MLERIVISNQMDICSTHCISSACPCTVGNLPCLDVTKLNQSEDGNIFQGQTFQYNNLHQDFT